MCANKNINLGTRIKKTDYMHRLFGYALPNRCDNEAFFSLTVDLTNVNKFLEELNADNQGYHYNTFQVIIAAICKATVLKPKLNRFYKGHKYYQRDGVSVGFTVKKKFEEKSAENVAVVNASAADNIVSIHTQMEKQIFECKSDNKTDKTDKSFNFLNSIPDFVLNIAAPIIVKLDKHGHAPKSLLDCNPYYSSWFVANLGSIGLSSVYHHLANYGSNSCFCTIGIIEPKQFMDDKGNVEIKQGVDLKITIDERIADGYYYSQAIKLIQKIVENPHLLLDEFGKSVN